VRVRVRPYARRMSDSGTWDLVLQIGWAGALVAALVLTARDYRNRR